MSSFVATSGVVGVSSKGSIYVCISIRSSVVADMWATWAQEAWTARSCGEGGSIVLPSRVVEVRKVARLRSEPFP